jgi:CRISPR-associated protein Cas2
LQVFCVEIVRTTSHLSQAGNLMRYLLIYDISHDGTRQKVADACLDYGLERIQFSAFFGELTQAHQRELLLKIKMRLGHHGANIQLFPLDERAWANRQVIECEERGTPHE